MMKRWIGALIILGISQISFAGAEALEYKLVIKDHRFQPTELKVPSGHKIKLVIENQDATAEEFESHDFDREKIVAPGATITVNVGPLEPGRYAFFGEFHMDTAQGALIVE